MFLILVATLALVLAGVRVWRGGDATVSAVPGGAPSNSITARAALVPRLAPDDLAAAEKGGAAWAASVEMISAAARRGRGVVVPIDPDNGPLRVERAAAIGYNQPVVRLTAGDVASMVQQSGPGVVPRAGVEAAISKIGSGAIVETVTGRAGLNAVAATIIVPSLTDPALAVVGRSAIVAALQDGTQRPFMLHVNDPSGLPLVVLTGLATNDPDASSVGTLWTHPALELDRGSGPVTR